MMSSGRCQALFSSGSTPWKTQSHRLLRNEAQFYIGPTFFKALRPRGSDPFIILECSWFWSIVVFIILWWFWWWQSHNHGNSLYQVALAITLLCNKLPPKPIAYKNKDVFHSVMGLWVALCWAGLGSRIWGWVWVCSMYFLFLLCLAATLTYSSHGESSV